MPLVDRKLVTPDEALAADLCPECGVDFHEINPHAHRLAHWQTAPPQEAANDESRRRIALYDKYLKEHPQVAKP